MMVAPGAWLGVLGGGQLGRMFAMAANRLGYRVMVLDPDPPSTAGAVADRHLCAALDAPMALAEMARACAAVTVETENAPTSALEHRAREVVVTIICIPVVMQNLLGELWDSGMPHWQVLLAEPRATLHLYGKAEARRGRKMGHFSCVAPTVNETLDTALRLRSLLPASAHTDRPGEIAATI